MSREWEEGDRLGEKGREKEKERRLYFNYFLLSDLNKPQVGQPDRVSNENQKQPIKQRGTSSKRPHGGLINKRLCFAQDYG